MNKNTEININLNMSSLLKFIIPSLVGILLFMTPIMINGQFTIPIAFLSNLVVDTLESVLPLIAVILISISAIGSI